MRQRAVGATRRALVAARLRGDGAGRRRLRSARHRRRSRRATGSPSPGRTLLGDGAAWIWRLGGEVLPAATWVLDRWHLTEARRRALRAALPDKAQRAPWSARLEERLEVGDVPGALAVLAEVAAVAPHPALAGFAGYLTTLAPAIPNYAERRAAGQRIGSGGIEKGRRRGGQPAAQRAARHALVAGPHRGDRGAARGAPQRRLGPPRPARPGHSEMYRLFAH